MVNYKLLVSDNQQQIRMSLKGCLLVDCKATVFVFSCGFQDVLRGAEGGEEDPQPQTHRKSSSSRSSRKSFRLDYRLEVKTCHPSHTASTAC